LHKFFILFVVLFAVFVFSGGVFTLTAYLSSSGLSAFAANCLLTGPFYGGCLLFGFMGFRFMVKDFRNVRSVFIGFLYVGFAYVGIEVLFSFL